MSIGQWSTTAANNATADPSINWQEGQAPSTVNDSARAMMAALAVWYGAAEWINPAVTPNYVSATQFTVAGNLTALYAVGRRVRTFNSGGAAVFGTISSSVYTTLTTVTLALDSGALDSGLSEADVGILNAQNSSLGSVSGTFTANGGILKAGSSALAAEAHLELQNSHTYGYFFLRNTDGVAGLYDESLNVIRWTSDAAGNFSVPGTITATGTVSCAGLNSGSAISAPGLSSTSTITATGNITSTGGNVVSNGPVYAGGGAGATLGTNGDINGTAWGGNLTAWLTANKLSIGNTYMHADNLHTYNVIWDGTRVNFQVDGTTVASVQGNAVSDRRAKTKIRSAEKRDSLALITALRFKSFDYKKAYGGSHRVIGVVAQEAPKDWVCANNAGILSMDERTMLYDALHAIKQLSARVRELEAKP